MTLEFLTFIWPIIIDVRKRGEISTQFDLCQQILLIWLSREFILTDCQTIGKTVHTKVNVERSLTAKTAREFIRKQIWILLNMFLFFNAFKSNFLICLTHQTCDFYFFAKDESEVIFLLIWSRSSNRIISGQAMGSPITPVFAPCWPFCSVVSSIAVPFLYTNRRITCRHFWPVFLLSHLTFTSEILILAFFYYSKFDRTRVLEGWKILEESNLNVFPKFGLSDFEKYLN